MPASDSNARMPNPPSPIREKLTAFADAVFSLPALLTLVVVVSFYLIWSLSTAPRKSGNNDLMRPTLRGSRTWP